MIPFHLGSAMVGKQLESKLMNNLHLCVDSLVVMHCNTNRPNISLLYPGNSYEDLAFIIKKNLGPGDKCPPKFLVFFNSWTKAQAGAEFLRAHLSPELCDKVKWFQSGMMDKFREVKMHALIISKSLGEASTDAAGMVGLKVLRFEFIITKGLLPIWNWYPQYQMDYSVPSYERA